MKLIVAFVNGTTKYLLINGVSISNTCISYCINGVNTVETWALKEISYASVDNEVIYDEDEI